MGEDKLEIRKCCYNCHSYLNDYYNCKGIENINVNFCHEYSKSLYMENEQMIKVKENNATTKRKKV